MVMHSSSLRLVERVCVALSLVAVLAAPVKAPASPPIQDPQDIALQAWHEYLQGIGWPEQLRDRWAPHFLGTLRETAANAHGGNTMTFDGSRPGVLATVTVVLDATGKVVQRPVVQLADVLEAR